MPNISKPRRSNHKKKAWKHIDLNEINEYLEDKELDERTGETGRGRFFIEKEGDSENLKADKLNKNVLSKVDREIINRPTTRSIVDNLNCFKHLKSTSAVPAFTSIRSANQKKTPEETVRQKKRLEKASNAFEQRKTFKERNKKDDGEKYDLWEVKEKTPIGDVYVDYAEDFEKVRLSRINKCQTKQNPNVLKKPSLLPAVEQPHPGLSYNPTKEEHTELLISIGEKKKKEIREKKRIKKLANEGFDPTVNVALENAKDMASGLFSEDDEEEEMDEVVNEDNSSKPVIISDLKRRKSRKAVRNEKRERADRLAKKERKDKKRLETEFTRIKHYVKLSNKAKEVTKLRMEDRKQRKIDKLYKPARLGKEKFTEQEPEYCLPEELNGSLRKINTDGNPIMDRFKNFQKRNIIEHRRVQGKKKARTSKKYVPKSSVVSIRTDDD